MQPTGQPASRQLSRRHGAMGRDAEDARVHLLCGRHARHHPADVGLGWPGRAHQPDPRGDRRLPGRGDRPQDEHSLQSKPGARACRAGLDLQLRGAARLAQPHDAVQGEGRQGSRERVRRPLCLSGADGGRHPCLSRHARAGRRRPEAAPGAVPRHRAEVQQRLRRSRSSAPVSRTASTFPCRSPSSWGRPRA